MGEHAGAVTFQGNPLTLVGDVPRVGAAAPEATVLGQDLSPLRIANWRGKTLVLVTVP